MAAKKISVKKIMLTLGAVLLLGGLALLCLAWLSMSFHLKPVEQAEAEETFSLKFDDFAIDFPKSFKLDNISISLNWPDARILMNEIWRPSHEEALKGLEDAKKVWAEKHGEVLDISAEMGFPALMVPEIAPIGLAERPVMMIGLVCGNVQLNFLLMITDSPANLERWKSGLVWRVRDFAPFYEPSPRRPRPGYEAAASGLRTECGTVSPGPRRAGYTVSPNFIHLSRGNQFFSINTIAWSERFLARPGFGGKISRFFHNLSNSGVISGIGLRADYLGELSAGHYGHEIIMQHPYLGLGSKMYDFNWQEEPQIPYAKWLGLSAADLSPHEAAVLYGQWRRILNSVRFINVPLVPEPASL